MRGNIKISDPTRRVKQKGESNSGYKAGGVGGVGYHDLYLVARDCDRLTIPTDKEEWRNEELHNDQSRRTTLPNECSLTTPVLRSLHIFGSSISRIFGSSIRYETSYKSQLYLKD